MTDEERELEEYFETLSEEHELYGNEDSYGIGTPEYNRGF